MTVSASINLQSITVPSGEDSDFCALVDILEASILEMLGPAADTVVITEVYGNGASRCYTEFSQRIFTRILEDGSSTVDDTLIQFIAGISVTEKCTGSTCDEANVGTPNEEVESTALQKIESALERSVSTTGGGQSTLIETIKTKAAESEEGNLVNNATVGDDAVTIGESSYEARILTSTPTTSPTHVSYP